MVKVSVIIAVWNNDPYLNAALASIAGQTFTDYEVLVFDDGSTDNSPEIARAWAARDERFKVFMGEHQGHTLHLNLGIDMASGEYIARMDSDDICMPERFAKQVSYLDEHPNCVAVGTQTLRIDPEGDSLSYIIFPTDHATIDARQMAGRGQIMNPTSMIRTSALRAIGGYRPEFEPGEDFDLFLQLAEVGELANLPDVLVKYRLHVKNVTVARRFHHQQVKQQALCEAYSRRGYTSEVPAIPLNKAPNTEPDFRFLWMGMALANGFYASARKNAWRGFTAQGLSLRSLKRLLIGYGGPLTNGFRASKRRVRNWLNPT